MRAALLCLLLGGCATASPAAPPTLAVPPEAVTSVPRWEYFCASVDRWVNPDRASEKLLEVAGQHGWELVTLQERDNDYRYCFKRPRA